ncbi:hypothetical protein HJG54_00230 [Leptolyngbya sp. NK1-12]|uniref:Uncharacterized protein n=1 Tax=Leptolyngbya sp. NK1-12 TaxID=2547451 RepID=A0AA96W813_9CYAN|nr:hypothetical protein [Leptolyngbya sp. NK1-12]WNZ21442.1 hypothetical protein HJG54_00230 [Leptolyngbya sp. NK1-12]
MVFKFLGKGKKSEYFLEAPPADNGAAPAAKVANKVAEVAGAVTDKVAEVADKVADQVTDKVAAVADAPAKPELTSNGAAPVNEAKSKAKKFKKTKTADSTASEAKVAEPAPVAKPVAKPAPQPEPVKNFATDYLMPSATPRRRPGPSLNMFRDMAKDVKTRK